MPGSVQECTEEYKKTLAKPFEEIQVHNKAVRMTAVKYPGADVRALNSLAIVETYLILHRRQRANIDEIIDWSGASNNWKKRVSKGIREAIEHNFLGVVGKTVFLNSSGLEVLEGYNSFFEEAKAIYLERAAKKLSQRKQEKPGRPKGYSPKLGYIVK